MNPAKGPLFFLVAGEESGDIHGARLIEQIKLRCPEASFFGHGGDKMRAEGMNLLEHTENLAMMGFTEVLKHLPYMLNVLGQTIKTIRERSPNRIILIDYPGFNLRLAKNIYHLGFPVTYFILPQVWAWKEKRVKILQRFVDQSLSIFPFEQPWFEQRGVKVNFVGHPFMDPLTPSITADAFYQKHRLQKDKPLLVLFPGSRQQEVDNHMPVFRKAVSLLDKDLQIIVGKALHVNLKEIPINWAVEDQDPSLCLEYGTAVLTSSGTATLQSAIHDIPAVVCYHMSSLSWFITRRMTHVPYAAMTNLIAGRKVVPEFLQSDFTPESLAGALIPLLHDSPKRKSMLLGYEEVRRTLGMPGAYERAAEAILSRTIAR